MKSKLIGFLIVLVFSVNLLAQDLFVKEFSLDEIEGNVLMELGTDQRMIIASSYSFTSNKTGLMIHGVNACGEQIWGKTIEHASVSLDLVDMRKDSLGNFLLSGNFGKIHNGARPYLMSFKEDGTINFFKKYETGIAIDNINYAIGVSPSNDYYLYFNYNTDPSQSNNKISLLKLRSNGQIQWFKNYDGITGGVQLRDWGRMIATSDGGIIARSGNVIFKVDGLGDVDWANQYLGSGISEIGFPIETPKGYAFFRQFTSGAVDRINLFMLNKDGVMQWNNGEYDDFYPERGILRKNGNILFVGSSNFRGRDFSFLEVNAESGELERFVNYGVTVLPQLRWAYDIVEDNDRNVLVSATRSGFFPDQKLVLAKYNDTITIDRCSPYSTFLFSRTFFPINTPAVTIRSTTNSGVVPVEEQINVLDLRLQDVNTTCSFSEPKVVPSIGNDTILCPSEPIVLSAGEFPSYLWSTGETEQTIEVVDSGLYWVEVVSSCDTLRDSIQIGLYPQINLQYEIIPLETRTKEEVRFTNQTTNAKPVHWDLGDGRELVGHNFVETYSLIGEFGVTFTVTSDEGCTFSDTTFIRILPSDYFIPNVFTPNSDGKNDVFAPSGNDIKSFELIVFNRWGETVYKNHNIAWNGKSSEGKSMNAGVYQFKLTIFFTDQSTTEVRGNITLLR